jgi:hypothetical protein
MRLGAVSPRIPDKWCADRPLPGLYIEAGLTKGEQQVHLKISKNIASYLGEEKLRALGLEWDTRGYREEFDLDLSILTIQQTQGLRVWLDESVKLGVRGPKVLVHDIDMWLRALKDAGGQHARTVHQFASLLTEYLRKVAGHRIYRRLDDEGKAFAAYYVDQVQYYPAQPRLPPRTELSLLHFELGGRMNSSIVFHSEDIFGMSASEALVKRGYFVESPELRAAYLDEVKRFNDITPRIGAQFIAEGSGTDDLDGNGGNHWSHWSGSRFTLDKAKVVIDVFYEDEKERHSREGYLSQHFWGRQTPKALVVTEDGGSEDDDIEATQRGDSDVQPIEIPTHPFCAVFDLRRHLRLKVHVNYLTEYQYDTAMGEKLILPEITKNLVNTLISQSKRGFSDIVSGKGMGVCILLGGVPGVGKTLTAEVFAEASERPLYSIQAAQLGIKADHVEENLVRFLARGSRWGAIVLLDEADVYIRERGYDMEHNAIVASILRVMEYQSSVLFMTTNLPKTTDDAILSRCIARINYDKPTRDEQREIWHVLAEINNVSLTWSAIRTFVERHPHLTGRDIKQLLKLAVLHVAKDGGDVTPDVIDFVAQFQPTIGADGGSPDETEVHVKAGKGKGL